ncbi:MAG: peptidylprolyl isomerase [Romboutsia sp.]|nr:peptidylprolyl isomerase [Romboutsia sp.]
MKRIISLALSSLLCISAVGCSSKSSDSEIVATVNGNNITVKQYKSTLELYKESLEAMYGTTIWDTEVEDGVKYKDKFKEIMLDQMIDIEAVIEQAKKDGLTPSKEEVDKAFEELKKNIDADEDYKKKLEEKGIDDTYLRQQQEQDLTIQNYKENFEKNVKISDEEMKKYYEEHKKDYYKDEVKASHILISTVDENGKEFSEAKKKEAKKKAEEVLKKAKSGEEFSQLAKEYSDDTGSAANGGDLGYFTKGQMVEPFEKAAFSLKVGQISDIVESQFGYHIIKVYDKIDEQLPFDDVKDEIKNTLIEDKYIANIEEISKKAKVEKNEDILKKVNF